MTLNEKIRDSITSTLARARRPIETRKYSKKLAKQFKTPQPRIWGNISTLKRSEELRFKVAKKGGKSYIVAP